MRAAHWLKPNHSTQSPQNAVWFDTETVEERVNDNTVSHKLEFGWLAHSYRGRNRRWSDPDWYRFTKRTEFASKLQSLTRDKTKLFVFCHNTNFDLPVVGIFDELHALGWKLKQACIDAPPTILVWEKGTRKIVVLDTLNIWRVPLRDLGQTVGLEKYDMPATWLDRETSDRYCKRDVEIIREACIQWWDMLVREDMGGFAHTLAGQAFRTYRHKFMHEQILIDANEQSLEMARRAYVGGRTEAFYIGRRQGNFTLVDINSQYPFVMASQLYPTKLITVVRRATLSDLRRWLQTDCLIADVIVRTDKPIYPDKQNGKLVFPVGTFPATLSTPEIAYALEHNHIVKVEKVACYSRADIFGSYVRYFYTRRLEAIAQGNELMATLYKLLLNSLYGKFGQRGIRWVTLDDTPIVIPGCWTDVDADTGEVTHYRRLGGIVQEQEEENESRDSHPAIAAHVTAYGRMLLWQLIEEAGRDHVYYCDTDSLLVDTVGANNLRARIDSGKLGALKEEYTCTDITIHGPKDYTFGNRSKTKGVRRSALWLGPNSVEQERWSSLRGIVRGGNTDISTTTTQRKTLKRIYGKGIVSPTGRVTPFRTASRVNYA